MKTKRSIQNEMILEYLKSVDTHPSADEIYDYVREKIPNISLGTVYRNLKKMMHGDKIVKISIENGADRFDGNTKPHYHFYCEKCLRVYDILMPYMDEPDNKINKVTENTVYSHSVMFKGICKNCGN